MARQKKAMKNENRIRTPATSAIPPLQLERLQRITLISPQCPICIVPIFNNLFVQHTHKHSVSDDSLSNASGWEQATWCFNRISLQLFLLSSSKFHLPHTEEPLIRWTVLNTAIWTHSLSEEHDPGRRKTKRKTRTGCNENSRIKQRLDLFYWEKALCTHAHALILPTFSSQVAIFHYRWKHEWALDVDLRLPDTRRATPGTRWKVIFHLLWHTQ